MVRALKKLGHFEDGEAVAEDADYPLAELHAASVKSLVLNSDETRKSAKLLRI